MQQPVAGEASAVLPARALDLHYPRSIGHFRININVGEIAERHQVQQPVAREASAIWPVRALDLQCFRSK